MQKFVFWVSDTNKTVFSRSIELDLSYMCMGYHIGWLTGHLLVILKMLVYLALLRQSMT